MNQRPAVVAFDVVETLFALEPLRARLRRAGLPTHALETWFAELLRDAFALGATGVYKPFREVAAATLEHLLARNGADAYRARIDEVIAGFAELDAHPDAAPAMRTLVDAGVRVVTLTNGSASVTQKLVERAGLRDLVERILSIDEVQRWKPQREVYLHCAEAVGVEPQRLALVAAHAWDIHGARRAGLVTAYVARDGGPFPDIMESPDCSGSTLVEVAEKLVAAT